MITGLYALYYNAEFEKNFNSYFDIGLHIQKFLEKQGIEYDKEALSKFRSSHGTEEFHGFTKVNLLGRFYRQIEGYFMKDEQASRAFNLRFNPTSVFRDGQIINYDVVQWEASVQLQSNQELTGNPFAQLVTLPPGSVLLHHAYYDFGLISLRYDVTLAIGVPRTNPPPKIGYPTS